MAIMRRKIIFKLKVSSIIPPEAIRPVKRKSHPFM
jgi:hypothetical protein